MTPGFGLRFEEFYARDGLVRVDRAFVGFVGDVEAARRARLEAARAAPAALAPKQESELLVALAPHLDDFLARLFGIEAGVHALSPRTPNFAPLYSAKRLF